ncbi:MAG: iron-containing alcohol dehydrogenase [Thermoprotei archaeon]
MNKPLSTHTIKLPVEVVVGDDVAVSAGKILSEHLEGRNALVLTGKNTLSLYAKKILVGLHEHGYRYRVAVVASASINEVERISSGKGRYDVVVGLGGGKVLDVGKVVAHRLTTPFVSIPTSASHDGIASPQASLSGLNGAHSIRVQMPYIIIADSKLISNSPTELTMSGVGDVLAKFSSVLDSRLAQSKGEYVGEYAMSLAEMSAKLVLANLEDIVALRRDGVRTLLEALISNGIAMAIAGSSRPCSGSEHMFGHALNMLMGNKLLHGYGVLLGTKISLALHKQDWRSVFDKVEAVNIPHHSKDLGIPNAFVLRALLFAQKIRPERLTILSEGMTLPRAKAVLSEVGEAST